jgi:NodT family efflux transporter outer membrane factor (OMF) lipoprotein
MNFIMHGRLWIARLMFLALLTAAGGCGTINNWVHNGFKVGPNYCKPAAPIADDWIDSYDERINTDLPNDQSWWYVFNDPAMSGLVQDAFAQNLTVRSAGMRVVQARTIRAITAGEWFPQQQESFGDYSRNQVSKNTFPGLLPGFPRAADFWDTGFDAFWEVDVWGKFRRNIESADASLDASIEGYDDILVILLADVAATYVEYRAVQQQLAYLNSNIKLQKISFSIADAQYKGGQVSELDPLQAQAIVQDSEQTVPALEAQLRNANLQLCTLLGIPPRDLSAELGDAPIPATPVNVAIGIPADLLRRRPDVRQAERQVAAQSAQIGVAAADLYPHFSISGNIRVEAGKLSDLFTTASTAGSVGPSFSWDILNYGRLMNNVRLQDAAFQQLAIDYQQTVLEANQEVESALVNFLKSQERLQGVSDLVTTTKKAAQIGVAQYRVGATDFNRVSNLLLDLVAAQDLLAETKGDVAQNLIAVYKAIGGGWQIRLGSTPQIPFDAFPNEVTSDDLPGPASQEGAGYADGQAAQDADRNADGERVDVPVEDASSKTTEDATAKPAQDAAKPVEEAPKPVEEAADPIEDAAEPVEDPAAKAAEEAMKAAEDAAKAAQDAAKAAQDGSRN